ncbi:MAG: aminopeptidase [Bacteroidales bacterium]|nr:aminopeptidase [Bacteroidales bacterium]MBQ5943696.1 aminopeptidase [Bacteroidales bacterium]
MKKTRILLVAAAAMLTVAATAQPGQAPRPKTYEYKFTTVKENPITSVKNQNRSGTCWCFSTLSFLESEAIRIKNITDPAKYPDFSEMYVVSKSYQDRADKYVRVDGNLGFSAGSEADDVLHVASDYGLVPQQAMPGLQALPVHGELDATTKSYVEAIAKNPNRTLSANWKKGFVAIVDTYLGECPETFTVDGVTYTPASYRDAMGIDPSNYVTLTSFTHHPFYTEFAIEVSDNWRWDTAWNVPIDEFMAVIDNAIEKGYTLAWGTDCSERGFDRNGVGVLLPALTSTSGSDQERWVGRKPGDADEAEPKAPVEIVPDQAYRQEGFDNKTTTDDHGMHIFGIAKDQNGTKFYMVKNSWGETGKYKGIWYCSENFVKGKSMDVMVHKDALPKDLRKKLGIK